MHMAAGLRRAGYRGAIATMWSVHDKMAAKLAREVNGFLFRESKATSSVEDAAETLWRAVQTLRERGVPLSRLLPFIHIGL